MTPGDAERVSVEITGSGDGPPWVIVPGMHGDRSLHGEFRELCGRRAVVVSLAYPRTIRWSLDDYAVGCIAALGERGIRSGWLVAESFGSQVAWAMAAASRPGAGFEILGLVLAGGFVNYPYKRNLALGRRLFSLCGEGDRYSVGARIFMSGYGAYAWVRHRGSGPGRAAVAEFLHERRIAGDVAAARRRLELIEGADFESVAREFRRPVWQMSGLWDPVVPWGPVGSWLERECPGYRGRALARLSDHTVLFSAAAWSARTAGVWISGFEKEKGR
jgi:hypothetical protein